MHEDRYPLSHPRSAGLVDVLDRVLDKGLVVAGDIKISLAEVELLTIRIRLIVCSIDKAQEIGMDWWKYDPQLSLGRQAIELENESLKRQVAQLEQRLASLDQRLEASERQQVVKEERGSRRKRERGAASRGLSEQRPEDAAALGAKEHARGGDGGHH